MAIAGPTTRLTVSVEAPSVTHELTAGKLSAWLESAGKTPREQAIEGQITAVSWGNVVRRDGLWRAW